MPLIHGNNVGEGGNPITIPALALWAGTHNGEDASFPYLQGNLHALGTHDAGLLQFGGDLSRMLAVGMTSCASVIYVSTHPNAPAVAWVHHANTGTLTYGDVATALTHLGILSIHQGVASVFVIYAHPKPTDSGYAQGVGVLVSNGIPPDNIVEIDELKNSSFGINSHGQIGF